MIKYLAILVVSVFLASCSKEAVKEDVVVAEETVVVKEAVVFDVRSAEEYQGGNLKNSINIPHDVIGEKIAEHVKSKDTKIVLYCRSGGRAGKAQKTLTDMGYTDVTNAGGYEGLKDK